MAIPFEDRVWLDVYEAIRVTPWASVWTRLPLALQTNPHVVIHTGGYFDFQFYFMRL
jgi:hypothetical protein